jgi:hypothetical protein
LPGGDPGDPDKQTTKANKKMYSGLIRKLANDELLKKGFVLGTLKPDAIFVFNSGLEERVSYNQANVNMGYGYDGIGYSVMAITMAVIILAEAKEEPVGKSMKRAWSILTCLMPKQKPFYGEVRQRKNLLPRVM